MVLLRAALVASLFRSSAYAAFTSAPVRAGGSISPHHLPNAFVPYNHGRRNPSSCTKRFLSSFDPADVQITRVGKDQMKEILEDVANSGREGSGFVVIDVRGEDEVASTGKLSPNVLTLPLPLIAQQMAFNLEEDDFEDRFGFAKPTPDETLVFTCKAGIRSYHAAQFAAMSGYTNLIDYMGGADDWFR